MNWHAFLDAVLAAVALYIGWQSDRSAPAMRMGCYLLAGAAVLGALRFSGLLPLPELHQFLSMLGAGVGLPLLALAVCQPSSAVAAQRRYTWIFAVTATVICVLVVMVAQIKLWPSVCAIAAALAILAFGAARRQRRVATAGLFMTAALAAFAVKMQGGGLQPGDFLHIGLALSLIMLSARIASPTV